MRVERVPHVRKDAEDVIAQAQAHLSKLQARMAFEQSGIDRAIRRTRACIAESRELMARMDVALHRFDHLLRGGRPEL
jgi:hypothetical protein